ncbi:Spliceosome RNA helicase Ddx39b [Hypsibius exemplaris]|uniref:RNA helicase n=1 Tax=Hypsibius exemplaris TaxID=2072580 RepID=A0A1W0WMZ0_HYPEX|nr:Spliceosome RNA helicase Ddx39b [Hypsibius exemplaris]
MNAVLVSTSKLSLGPSKGELLNYEVKEETRDLANADGDTNGDILVDDGEDGEVMAETEQKHKPVDFTGHAFLHSSTFQEMMLKPELIKAISEHGFTNPSEVQFQCIPKAMMGLDILCQAKSGMGKTAVYVITSLQELDSASVEQPSILVLAPTRELAYQIATEFQRFKKYMTGARLALFFGGTSVAQDIENLRTGTSVQIVIGTPGRLRALIDAKALDLSHIKTFIVDECDKMLIGLDMRADVQYIFKATPVRKQVMMLSATLPREIQAVCKNFMQNPEILTVADDCDLTLEKLQQHYLKMVEAEKTKNLMELLDLLEFNQVIVFTNTVVRCLALAELLEKAAFPVIAIHSSMTQEDRLARYHQFKSFEKRLLVATDLFGRGMDIQNVNIVINYDCPIDTDTYLHRIARAGRFNSKGLAVTFIASERDSQIMNEVQDRFDISVTDLPDEIDCGLYMDK